MKQLICSLLIVAFLSLEFLFRSILGHEASLSRPVSKFLGKHAFSNYPRQIHLSVGSQPSTIVVMWSTEFNESGYVQYGNDPRTLTKAFGTVTELKEHSDQALKFIHRAELKNLSPGSRYSYRILSTQSDAKSEVLHFTVPHNNLTKPHFFMVLADMGTTTKGFEFVVQEARNGNYDAVFHIGDISYNLDSGGGRKGDEYMERVQEFAATVPYLTSPGDHESTYSFYHYRHRFSMPGNTWPMPEDSLWYSLDIGFTHFISVNSEYLVRPGPHRDRHLEWLKADLKRANENRKLRPWIIVHGHKPLYCSKSRMEQECDKEESSYRQHLEDIFFEEGVDLMLSGHKHAYERSWPIYKGRIFQTDYINPAAPVYIITGALGLEIFRDGQLSKPNWLAFAMNNNEKELFGRLKVKNQTHLEWTAHAARNNEEVDTVWLIQKNHGSFGKAGEGAFEKLRYEHVNQLPQEPLTIVDEPLSVPRQYRRFILFSTVIALSFILCLFLRNPKIRKLLRLQWSVLW